MAIREHPYPGSQFALPLEQKFIGVLFVVDQICSQRVAIVGPYEVQVFWIIRIDSLESLCDVCCCWSITNIIRDSMLEEYVICWPDLVSVKEWPQAMLLCSIAD